MERTFYCPNCSTVLAEENDFTSKVFGETCISEDIRHIVWNDDIWHLKRKRKHYIVGCPECMKTIALKI